MENRFVLSHIETALIVGAGHGIGLALAKRVCTLSPQAKVYATFRRSEQAHGLRELAEQHQERLHLLHLDPLEEEDLARAAASLPPDVSLDLILVSVGALQDEAKGIQPERALRELTLESLTNSFAVNACVTPLVAKHFAPKLSRSRPVALAALSAQVGSIGDNRLGGWYGYRASKAALGMFLKTMSIELKRAHGDRLSVLAVHPGTTETNLSRPFLRGVKHRVFTPDESAERILDTIERCHSEGTGLFKNFDGTDLPW